jgi:hypothetical protein
MLHMNALDLPFGLMETKLPKAYGLVVFRQIEVVVCASSDLAKSRDVTQ